VPTFPQRTPGSARDDLRRMSITAGDLSGLGRTKSGTLGRRSAVGQSDELACTWHASWPAPVARSGWASLELRAAWRPGVQACARRMRSDRPASATHDVEHSRDDAGSLAAPAVSARSNALRGPTVTVLAACVLSSHGVHSAGPGSDAQGRDGCPTV